MTQRLTPERESEIRLAVKRQQLFGGHSEDLLAEIEALRAELAGAEERGRQQAVELLNGYMLSKLRSRGEPLYLSEICELRDQLVRTGTAAADAGEPGNG